MIITEVAEKAVLQKTLAALRQKDGDVLDNGSSHIWMSLEDKGPILA